MKLTQFKLITLLLAISAIAILLSAFVEQRTVIGQSSTRSPDGNWSLNLRLVKYSTLFSSRKKLDADVEHATNKHWDVKTSIPLDEADPETISDQSPDHPIVWSEDSTTVNYWINGQFEDSISIHVNENEHVFHRKLYSTTVTTSSKKGGE